jgi:hypothetical protein
MSRHFAIATAILAALSLSAGYAMAQAGKAKSATSLTLTNKRSVPLIAFEVSQGGEGGKIVARLNKPLAPGKKLVMPFKGGKGCVYDLRGAFADDSEVETENYDICRGGPVNLTE